MKKQKTIATVNYNIDQDALDQQLSLDFSGNWIISEGAERFKEGKILGKNMILFLEHLQILVKTK